MDRQRPWLLGLTNQVEQLRCRTSSLSSPGGAGSLPGFFSRQAVGASVRLHARAAFHRPSHRQPVGYFYALLRHLRSFDEFLREHDLSEALTKFIISAADVSALRDQLDLAGIDERRLFPDLDGVAAELRRYYA